MGKIKRFLVTQSLCSSHSRLESKSTLEICSLVAGDTEDMVIKSLSWALRELAKRDTKPVKAFIKKYTEVLSAKVKREVCKKIETGTK